jgi:pimeloyl-ACP methyl ester carboxylesterase
MKVMDVRSHDGVPLHAEVAGDGANVMLIHGTSAPGSWGRVGEELAEGLRVVTYDRRGYGSSGGDPTPDNQVHARDAAAMLRALDAEPATVVGWSRGGAVALELALAEPELVQRLVLVEPVFEAPKHIDRGFVRALLGFELRRRLDTRRAIDGLFSWVSDRREGTSAWDDPEFPKDIKELCFDNSRGILGEWKLRQPDRLTRERVARIQAPMAVLVGEQSQPWFARMAQAVVDAAPNARLVSVPGATHAFVYTAADAIIGQTRQAVAADPSAAHSSGTTDLPAAT